MNLLKSPVRRATAVIAGAVLGMAGAVALAAPASAHHPIVNPGDRCKNADGTWQVTWHVRNSETDLEGEISAVRTTRDIAIPGIAVGTKLPKNGDGYASGTQQLPADVRTAKLWVKGHWVRNGQNIDSPNWAYGELDKPTKPCAPAPSSPPPSSPPPSSPPPSNPPPSSPPPSSQAPSNPPPSSNPPATPGEPTPIVDADCDSITLGLDNPDNGVAVKLDFETSKGEKRSVTVAPGEKKTEKFSATEGFKVTITVTIGEKSASETVTYQKPEDCAAGGAGGGGLALTGAAAGSIASGAGLLLAVGAFLFLMARRRKVKFTA